MMESLNFLQTVLFVLVLLASTKVIAMDSSGNLDLPVGTDIRFGGDAAKSIKFDGSGNLEVPDTAELRFEIVELRN